MTGNLNKGLRWWNSTAHITTHGPVTERARAALLRKLGGLDAGLTHAAGNGQAGLRASCCAPKGGMTRCCKVSRVLERTPAKAMNAMPFSARGCVAAEPPGGGVEISVGHITRGISKTGIRVGEVIAPRAASGSRRISTSSPNGCGPAGGGPVPMSSAEGRTGGRDPSPTPRGTRRSGSSCWARDRAVGPGPLGDGDGETWRAILARLPSPSSPPGCGTGATPGI